MATETIERAGIAGHGAGQDFKHREGITAKYGRMFPAPETPSADENALITLGRSGAVMDDVSGTDAASSWDNHCIPAGFTFFGQFIAHDTQLTGALVLDPQGVRGTLPQARIWVSRFPLLPVSPVSPYPYPPLS